jgi:hypothetical protein
MNQSAREAFDALGKENLGIQDIALGSIPKSIGRAAGELGYGAPRSANPPRAQLWPGITGKAADGDAPSVANAGGGPLSEAERTQLQSLLARLIGTK